MTDRLEEIRKRCDAATPIPGFINYRADKLGCVYSTTNWRGFDARELQQFLNSDGYPSVRLQSNKRIHLSVHKIMAITFLSKPDFANAQICYKDGNRQNNQLTNLYWGTALDNARDRQNHQTTARGSKNGFSKLDENAVRQIKQLLGRHSQRWIAKHFDVSQTCICRINTAKTWSVQ